MDFTDGLFTLTDNWTPRQPSRRTRYFEGRQELTKEEYERRLEEVKRITRDPDGTIPIDRR